jgi:extracellular solute-binding protein family 5
LEHAREHRKQERIRGLENGACAHSTRTSCYGFKSKKCLLCLTLLAALCGSLPAALAQPAAPAARTGRIERVTIADERGDHGLPSPFTHAPDGVGYALTMLVFDSLLWRDRQGHLVPALARQWRESEDRLAVEFELHPQARWHDGQPVTAGDVAFTFDYFRQHPNPFMDVSAVAGVDALAGGFPARSVRFAREHARPAGRLRPGRYGKGGSSRSYSSSNKANYLRFI